jgi:hypothetical protein
LRLRVGFWTVEVAGEDSSVTGPAWSGGLVSIDEL